MSVEAMGYVWGTTHKPSKKLVLMAIADRADEFGVCFPGVSTIAKKASITLRQAQRLLADLENEGELVVGLHAGIETGRGKTSIYYMKKYRDSIGKDTPVMLTRALQKGTTPPKGQRTKIVDVSPVTPQDTTPVTRLHHQDVSPMTGVDVTSATGVDVSPTTRNTSGDSSGNTSESTPLPPLRLIVQQLRGQVIPNASRYWTQMVHLIFWTAFFETLETQEREQTERNKQISAIIKVHLDTGVIMEKGKNPYQIPAFRNKAEALLDAGFSPEDVQDYVDDLRADDWWRSKSISLDYILKNIKAWADDGNNTSSPAHEEWVPPEGYFSSMGGEVPVEQRGPYYDQMQESKKLLLQLMSPEYA